MRTEARGSVSRVNDFNFIDRGLWIVDKEVGYWMSLGTTLNAEP